MIKPQFGVNDSSTQQPDSSKSTNYNTNGLLPLAIGTANTALKLTPAPVGVGIGLATDVLSRAADHMPISTPIPKVPMNPSWVSNK